VPWPRCIVSFGLGLGDGSSGDAYGGMPPNRVIWDTAAALDQSVAPPLFRPLSQPNEMATLWRELGLLDVEQTGLLIRMEFSGFDDFWLHSQAKDRWHSSSPVFPTLPD
jgi:hypothetical protein